MRRQGARGGKNDDEHAKQTILDVDGMTCSSRVRHVSGALRQLEGACAVEVQLRTAKVRVEHREAKPDLARMVKALADAGYDSPSAE